MKFNIFGKNVELQSLEVAPYRFEVVDENGNHCGCVMLGQDGHWGYAYGIYRRLNDALASEIVDEIVRHPDWVKELSRHKAYLLQDIPRRIKPHQEWIDKYTSGLEYLKAETRF